MKQYEGKLITVYCFLIFCNYFIIWMIRDCSFVCCSYISHKIFLVIINTANSSFNICKSVSVIWHAQRHIWFSGFKSTCRAFSFLYRFSCQAQNLDLVYMEILGIFFFCFLPSIEGQTFFFQKNCVEHMFCIFLDVSLTKTDVLLLSLLLFFNIFFLKKVDVGSWNISFYFYGKTSITYA